MAPFRQRQPYVFTTLLTPFSGDGVDYNALEAAVDRQLAAGMDGIVVLDAFGEGPVLDDRERDEILAACIRRAGRHLSVIAATGTNSTATTIERSRRAAELGADALMVTVPYYSKPRLASVLDHFRALAQAVDLPVIVDDDPGRTALDLGTGLLSGLAETGGIAGICHGPGRLPFFAGLPADLLQRYVHLSKDDALLPAFLAAGGRGAVSPLGNILPSHLKSVVAAQGSISAMAAMIEEIAPALRAVGRGDVAALKEAASFIHQHPVDVRLPLVAAEPETVVRIRHAFAPFARVEEPSLVAPAPYARHSAATAAIGGSRAARR